MSNHLMRLYQTEIQVFAVELIAVSGSFTEAVEVSLCQLPLPVQGRQTALETTAAQATAQLFIHVPIVHVPGHFAFDTEISGHSSVPFWLSWAFLLGPFWHAVRGVGHIGLEPGGHGILIGIGREKL